MDTEISKSVTFRLSPELNRRLITLGKSSGVTKHALARTIVVRELESPGSSEVVTSLAAIEEQMLLLRKAFARGIAAILQNVTDLEEKAVRDWVDQRLLGDDEAPESEPEEHES